MPRSPARLRQFVLVPSVVPTAQPSTTLTPGFVDVSNSESPHPENAYSPMLVTLFGIVTLAKLPQSWNAKLPIFVTLDGNETEFNPEHPLKAWSPTFLTPFGIVTLFSPVMF